jgi:lactate dehydrogenase-like 2-hydroxyacid dehydrogenase
LVTRKIPEDGFEVLKAVCRTVDVYDGKRPIPRRTLLSRIKGKDGLLCLLTDKIDGPVMDASGKLKVISNFAVGYDNIDIEAALQRGIVVTNTPGVLTEATAELTWALILSVARRIIECDRHTRSGKFSGWDPLGFVGADIQGRTLGIVGAGRIGTAVGLKAAGFHMKVLYYDSLPNTVLEECVSAKKVKLKTLLRESDFVTVHLPLSEQTSRLFSVEQFDLMKPSAIFINTSRGKVVDEKALIRALKSKSIAGAGLDVYEQEPEIEPELLKLKKVVLCPHVGSATLETRKKMAVMACRDLVAALSGERPANVVSPGDRKKGKPPGAALRR